MSQNVIILVGIAAAVALALVVLRKASGPTLLAENVSIETLGDTATPLFLTDSALPVEKSEIFSTAADEQLSIDIHLVHGNARAASANRTVGRYQIVDIPPMPRGTPQIAVTFSIDSSGNVSLRAVMDGQRLDVRTTGDAVEPAAVR